MCGRQGIMPHAALVQRTFQVVLNSRRPVEQPQGSAGYWGHPPPSGLDTLQTLHWTASTCVDWGQRLNVPWNVLVLRTQVASQQTGGIKNELLTSAG